MTGISGKGFPSEGEFDRAWDGLTGVTGHARLPGPGFNDGTPVEAISPAGLTGLEFDGTAIGRAWLSGLGFNRGAPVDVLVALLDAGEAAFLWREDLPAEVIDAAVVHELREVRATAAESGRLSPAQCERLIAATPEPRLRALFAELAEDAEADRRRPRVRRGVASAPHPDATPPRTPAEIAAMAADVPDIPANHRTYALWWIGALHDDADAMRRLASSPKLLIRRSVARAPRLPADVAALLAGDPDDTVRLFLAESCDDAPPEMLLEVAGWWEGSLSFPGRPRSHPRFPRTGLLHLASDPNPRLRALALIDPAATAELADQFAHDPDPVTRAAAAADHRLTPESLRRLAADPDHSVRRPARLNPSLPTDTLVKLLLDPDSAREAARNPAIPVPVMHHMITLTAQGT
ncbi:hypothetical protein [Actinoplanes couchii]|uniref:Leucine rich repeat variant n=1 Tax=Actinoplanes couchii TaxID=403638 RepID=A0ABQ3XL13_9ACTN|nr:hypothetical protein [Actinoplanes couchii]MDR6319444.1 hypothetical protein [Actinoplanes couchii]GID59165.1 hypothetical protein Aco03nite_075690 [Actinoplanes couchii]